MNVTRFPILTRCDCIYLDIPNMCLVAVNIHKYTIIIVCIRNADDSLVYNAFDVQHHNCVASSDSIHTITTIEKR